MSSALEIDGKKMLPVKEVITQVSYTRDYVTRLARENKIEAVHVGRQWFVNLESLKRYTELTLAEKEIRKQKYRVERKREKEIHDAIKKQREVSTKRAKTLNAKATTTASLVLTLGLLGGMTFFNYSQTNSRESNLATVSEAEVKTEQTIQPTSEVRSLGESKQGILLLPQSQPESVADLFSDEVEIIETKEGTKAVVLFSEDGEETEKEIPFLEVPVKQRNN